MCLNFRDVTLEDKQWIEPLLKMSSGTTLEYSFTTTFVWRHSFGHRVARMDDYFLLRVDRKAPAYLFPSGRGPLEPVIRALAADAKQLGVPLIFSGVSADAKARLEAMFPDQFSFEPDRDGADYIYETQALATLRGNTLSGKRNHINRFLKNYPDWRYETISGNNLEDVRRMNALWCVQNGCADDRAISEEYCAVESAIRHYGELGLSGGLLRTGGKVVAFSIGDPLNDDTFLVHFEKAFADVKGAYQMINQQFVLHHCMAYKYVNREEDAGVEGLRIAKLSYHPALLAEKYTATLKGRL